MKMKQKLISLILSLTIAMGLATAPAFASSPDTSYFINSQRYYWTGASGTHDLPSNTKLGNLVAMGIDYLSLDLAAVNSSLGQLYSLVNTGLGTINDSVIPIRELKESNWGSTLNLYAIPSGYGSSWYAQILRGFYDIKGLSQDIKSYLFTVTGNQTSIINKLNSGISVTLDSTVEGYLQNTSEQLTTQSSILNSNLPGIKSIATEISNKLTSYNTGSNFGGYFIQSWQTNNSLRNIITGNNPKPNYNTNNNGLITYIRNGSNASIFYGTAVNPDTTFRHLSYQSSALSTIQQFMFLPGTYYNMYWGDNNGGMVERHALSIADYLTGISYQLSQSLNPLQYMLADPNSVTAKRNNASQESAALTNFTGSGDASASASDFVGVKDSVSALKTSLSGGASYTQAFNILGGDSDGWSWFSQEVADSMDTTNSTRGLLRGNISSSTPYLDSYYDSIFSVIGIGGDIE